MQQTQKALPNHLLRHAREARGWSQEVLAKALETSAMTVYRWESGQTVPGPFYRQKLTQLFEQSATALGLIAAEDDPAIPRIVPPYRPALSPLAPLHAGLIGRQDMLDALKEHISRTDRATTLALYGLPGIGKTALATELAHDEDVLAQFPDGILWAGLGPKPNLMTILNTWGQVIGLTQEEMTKFTHRDDVSRAIHAVIGRRRMLLIIDDVWDINDALACKVGGPECVHLITTRSPALAAQFAHKDTIALHELSMAEGIALLARLAPAALEQVPVGASLRQLVQSVGGLPLALSVIGHHLQRLALSKQPRRVTHMLEQLQQTETRLRLEVAVAPTERPPHLPSGASLSLHAAIAISEQAISPEARQVLRMLAIFPPKPNSFSEDAAYAVAGMPVEPFFASLDILLDVGLVESVEAGHYTLHQVIADYAHHDDDILAQQRLISYWIEQLDQGKTNYAALNQELLNIFAALALASRPEHEGLFFRLVPPATDFLIWRGLSQEAESYVRQALARLETSENYDATLRTLRQLSHVSLVQGAISAAISTARTGIALAQHHEVPLLETPFYNILSQALIYQGDHAQAEVVLHEGMRLVAATGDQETGSRLLWKLSGLAQRDDLALAEHYCRQGLAMAQADGHAENISASLQQLGVIAGKSGKYHESETYSLEALSIARTLGNHERIAGLLANLAMAASEQGNLATAHTYLVEALALARQTHQPARICAILSNLGMLATRQERYDDAEAFLREGLALARSNSNVEQAVVMSRYLGEMTMQQHQFAAAHRQFAEALIMAQPLGDKRLLSAILAKKSEALYHQQRFSEALVDAQDAHDYAQQGEYLPEAAAALYMRARLAAALDDLSAARQLGQASLDIYAALGHRHAHLVGEWLATLPAITQATLGDDTDIPDQTPANEAE